MARGAPARNVGRAMAAADSTAFRALSDVVLAIASEHEVEPVLQLLVHSARELAGARYAALGIPDGEGAFASFITSGMSDELIEAMGPLPRTHGMLGAMLDSAEPHLTDDITADPRFRGWWPSAHPQMRSFLGVPIVARGEVIGALYLTEKEDGSTFSRRRPEADRAARRARRDRDRERAPARAQPRAVDHRGAQPARARAARLGHAAAVRRSRWRPSRPRRCSPAIATARRPSCGACPSSRAARWRSCARSSSSCGRGRWRPRVWRPCCASTSTCCAASTSARSTCASATSRGSLPGPATQVLRIAQEALGNALRHAGADAIDVRLHGADGGCPDRQPTTAAASIPRAPRCAGSGSG